MRARDLERWLVFSGWWTQSQLDQTSRFLRQNHHLPVGGRGLNAPDIAPEHGANVLAALCFGDSPLMAPNAMEYFAALATTGGKKDILGNKTFRDSLIQILGDPDLAGRVAEVNIYTSYPFASIEFAGDEDHFDTYHLPGTQPPGNLSGALYRLTGEFLRGMAAQLVVRGPAGEPGDG